jgi:ferrous iron transport protein B
MNIEERKSRTQIIDHFVTHKIFGFPIFFLFIWIMFECTFKLGRYPMSWIQSLIGWIGSVLGEQMAEGPFKDLLINGIIGGVGGVIVFLPNILILYLFISFMEDSGYMARAAFIMDKVMHKMGLHGKSFIPLIMGFGCNVPAIMGTRIIENSNSRMITMLIIPFMSCGARLPIYLLFAGSFFPEHGALVLLTLYVLGILMGVFVSKFLRKYIFKEEEEHFAPELPPYRIPAFRSVVIQVWNNAKQYLKKMGGIILVGSIVIWFLSYFPRSTETEETGKQTYIERLGHITEPVIRPLGFTWEMGVSLISGIVAKETIISTLGVLYTESSDAKSVSLSERLKTVRNDAGELVYTPLVAFCFMLFVLLYFPCLASVVAIKNESGGWKWAMAAVFYTCALAWVVSFVVYQAGRFWGL